MRLPAFAIQDAEINGAILRTVAYVASSGVPGVVTPDAMKVTAAGSSVSIAPGAATIPTRYASSPSFNAYVAASTAPESLAIPATGSGGGATRYIIARIDDPEYGGQGDVEGVYWRFEQVSSITNLPYPFVALARINQPASTVAITDAMIVDLRVVSTPRRVRDARDLLATGSQDLTSTTFVDFPVGTALVLVGVTTLDFLDSEGARPGQQVVGVQLVALGDDGLREVHVRYSFPGRRKG